MDQTLLLIGFVVLMGGFMFWSQWRARKRYQEKMESFQAGDRVVTIGGIYGRLTYLDRETSMARLEIAPGVEIEIGLGAISRQVEAGSVE
ncbi:MAG: preprotein translocase subunit YajC [Anaerolineae bacterium]|nr:preprotein translocase subunit YajC [Anaerolineae bacterium]